jgi:glycosyltransferase involved in cell wall biosynthesis
MNIAMFTNTYLPHVGGVANSVRRFADGFARRGHGVLIVAPDYGEASGDEHRVVRVPALRKVSGDFSMPLPGAWGLDEALGQFGPDLVHSHHPYLVGDVALRVSAERKLPILFTHHTRYEHYVHYTPFDSDAAARLLVRVATGYEELVDRVIAPSGSMRAILRGRGVTTPVDVIPTGVDLQEYAGGDGAEARRTHGIPADALVVGHVGRLAKEKNLVFVARAAAEFLRKNAQAHALVVGRGDAEDRMQQVFSEAGVAERAHFTGALTGQTLIDAYHAMDAFLFASKTETQGMVLVEALAAGCPLVALDAPGSREVVREGENGHLIEAEDAGAFAEALADLAERYEDGEDLPGRARASAAPFAVGECVEKALASYRTAVAAERGSIDLENSSWAGFRRMLEQEWHLWSERVDALTDIVSGEESAGETGP